MSQPSDESRELVARAAAGDQLALASLFARYRERLRRMVSLRLHPRLSTRIDPSDVVQEAYLEMTRGLGDYLRGPQTPFYLWLRHITAQRLIMAHRHHLQADMRSVLKEVPGCDEGWAPSSSYSIAAHLVSNLTSPSAAALRNELLRELHDALERLEPIDREVIVLRHFEQLGNQEAAEVLGIDASAASNRYVRALQRLKRALEKLGTYSARTNETAGP